MKINQENTQKKISTGNLVIGDYFSEMASFWVYVCQLNGDEIITIERIGQDLSLRAYSNIEEFKKRFRYTTMNDSYWIYYHGNNEKRAEDMMKMYKKIAPDKFESRRNLNIEKVVYNI